MSTIVELRRQSAVLSARYRDCLLGDWSTTLFLVLQAPFIGWLCTLVWGSVETDTPTLYFVLSLSAVWFGCINACREIVKERAIVERERFFGLSMGAYVLSKARVLAGLSLAQVVLLQFSVEWKIGIRGPMVFQLLALFLGAVAGTGLGLIVSAMSSRQERAVGAVPLLLLPQILFSKFAIPEERFGDLVRFIEKAMPVRWSFEVFEECAATAPNWFSVVGALLFLAILALVFLMLAVVAMMPRREPA
ncbi:MAG: ABC transporter permease [Myxococcota bacterium]